MVWAAAFLVVADEGYGRQIPFAFLEKVKEEFLHKYGAEAQTKAAHSLDSTFGCDLQSLLLVPHKMVNTGLCFSP